MDLTLEEVDSIVSKTKQLDAFGLPPNATHGGNKDRAAQLATNAKLRNAGLQRKHEQFAPVCVIPPLDWEVLKILNPELNSPDNETNKAAWRRFLKSDESLIYRVDAHRKRKPFQGIIIP